MTGAASSDEVADIDSSDENDTESLDEEEPATLDSLVEESDTAGMVEGKHVGDRRFRGIEGHRHILAYTKSSIGRI